MTETQKQASLAALAAWVGPQIEAANWMERGAIQSYFDQHKEAMVEVIINAALSVPGDPPAS